MPVLLLTGFLSLLVAAPLLTHRVYRAAYARERAQIALDNAAIASGRSDRATLRALDSANRLLSRLDAIHHPLHACAMVPATAAECAPADRAIEARIRLLHAETERAAQASWRLGHAAAGAEAVRLGETLGDVERSRLVLVPSSCGSCGLPSAWTVASLPLRSVFTSGRARTAMRLVSSREGWDYLLEAPP